jgi:hypothetical protein
MIEYPHFDAWLSCLMHLTPPEGVAYVGAGGVLPNSYARMPRLFVAESDLDNYRRLQKQLEHHPDCRVIQAVVAGHTGEAEFYSLSQSNESSLCPTDQLQRLWPNIKTLHTTTKPVIALEDLFEQASLLARQFNWVVVDCLPAGELLKGAGMLPAYWDVLIIRALKGMPVLEDECELRVASIQDQLLGFGLELVAMEDENHPQVVRALFVRNLTRRKAMAIGEVLTRCDSITRERDAALDSCMQLEREKSMLEADIAKLTKANSESAELSNANANEKVEAFAYCEALANKLSEAYVQRFQTSQENAMLKAKNAELVVAIQRFESNSPDKYIAGLNIRQ